MLRHIKKMIVLAGAVLVSAVSAYGAFENTAGAGARVSGMGGAFTGLADDVYSVHYNPAGLVSLGGIELALGGASLYHGLSDGSVMGSNSAAIGFPIKRGFALGLNYYDLVLADAYSEKTARLAAGLSVSGKISAGLAIKSLSQGYVLNRYYADDPVFAGGSALSAGDLDLGILAKPLKHFSAGLNFTNLLKSRYGLESNAARLPGAAALGIAYSEEGMEFAVDTVYRQFNNVSDLYDEELRLNMGFEKWFIRKPGPEDGFLIAFRAGLGWDIGQFLPTPSNRGYKSISAGIGFNLGWFRFDYGIIVPLSGVEDTNGISRFDFLIKFGKIYNRKIIGEPEREKKEKVVKPVIEKAGDKIAIIGEIINIPVSSGAASGITASGKEKPKPAVEKAAAASAPAVEIVRVSSPVVQVAVSTAAISKTAEAVLASRVPEAVALSSGIPEAAKKAVKAASPAEKKEVKSVEANEEVAVSTAAFIEKPAVKQPAPAAGAATKNVEAEKKEVKKAAESGKIRFAEEKEVTAAEYHDLNRRHLVRLGDTLSSLAEKYYKDSRKWVRIYDANRDKIEKGVIRPDQVLVIP